MQPLFCCQVNRSTFKKPWSTFRSWSSVQKCFLTRSTSETLSVRRGICCRTILLLCLGWRRNALATAHFSLRGMKSLKMTRRLSVLTSIKFTLKNPAQTQQVHQTQNWNCKKCIKITMHCRMITAHIKKLGNQLWYLSQCLVSSSFFSDSVLLSEKWTMAKALLRHPSKVIKLFCNGCLFWLTMFHLLTLLEKIPGLYFSSWM